MLFGSTKLRTALKHNVEGFVLHLIPIKINFNILKNRSLISVNYLQKYDLNYRIPLGHGSSPTHNEHCNHPKKRKKTL